MHLNDAFRSALQSISNHKLRSFLTLTGIVIGVLAVVTMFSSVFALKTMVKTNMEGLGWNNSIMIVPNYRTQSDNTNRRVLYRKPVQSNTPISYSDYIAIRDNVPLEVVYGISDIGSQYRLGNKSVMVTLRGTNPVFFTNKNYDLKYGRYFNEFDDENAHPVAVLGYYFAQEQFGNTNPVGRQIRIGDHRFKVIGVLDSDRLNKKEGFNFNTYQRNLDLKAVYIPLKFTAIYLSPERSISHIFVQTRKDQSISEVRNQIRQLLLARHSMAENFIFLDIGETMMQVTQEIDKNMRKWNITLFVIASISLIVGGIGLFSTLLISIQEKMMEIGVRKSIGATDGDIFFYFIFEAISLAILGALLGISLAALALAGMQAALKFPLPMPFQGIAVGMSFSVLVGFLSGLYPALKAAGLNPITAIYYYD